MKKLVTLSVLVLTTIGLTATPVAAATYDSNASVKFKAGTGITPPVDPTNPTDKVTPVDPLDPLKPVQPGTNGPLSIDYASSLYFGEQDITSSNETYYAVPQKLSDDTERPNYVQVSDNRGTLAGWSLQVKQNGQFKTATNKELTGAQITFENAELATVSTATAPSVIKTSFTLGTDGTGVAENVIAAKAEEGAGTFVYRFGNDATKGDSIKLDVPGSTAKYAEEYTTTLTWTLTDVPGN